MNKVKFQRNTICTITFAYKSIDLLPQDPDNRVVRYSYDLNGNLIRTKVD
ncbi:hypothetical protein GC101_10480 [Paenibacillus sp. LMG 31459]|uniref:YD repeat-containing protein n=1 Tax=Paenibacillus phytohabitans TaxID=2654978 RepID=A0ABX1YEA6_9BACL|nr:hypothetical protein [Paenibacillus phytohabitans]